MKRLLPIGLLVAGVVLLVFGFNSSNSFNSEVSKVFTGSPTDKAMWLMIGGGILGAMGLFGLFKGSKA
jgi:hypothetical protein